MAVNPYHTTDSMGVFESGDSFIVYPGKNEVYDSLRIEILNDAFQDYSALNLLEQLTSRDYILNLLACEGISDFNIYPKSVQWH